MLMLTRVTARHPTYRRTGKLQSLAFSTVIRPSLVTVWTPTQHGQLGGMCGWETRLVLGWLVGFEGSSQQLTRSHKTPSPTYQQRPAASVGELQLTMGQPCVILFALGPGSRRAAHFKATCPPRSIFTGDFSFWSSQSLRNLASDDQRTGREAP